MRPKRRSCCPVCTRRITEQGNGGRVPDRSPRRGDACSGDRPRAGRSEFVSAAKTAIPRMNLPTEVRSGEGDRQGTDWQSCLNGVTAATFNGPWFITFAWQDGEALRVDLEQYHRREGMTEHSVKRPLERPPLHPGEVLREDVLPALGLSVSEAAKRLSVSRQQLHRILACTHPITVEMALRIGRLVAMVPDSGSGCNRTTICGVWSRDCGANWKRLHRPRRYAPISPSTTEGSAIPAD